MTAASTPPVLIIPVETQVRELDAKLLVACCAVERGWRVILGSRAYVHFAMADMPRGVYLAKSMRGMSHLMFRLIRELGHDIVAWEEEALVHPPAQMFYSVRLSPGTVPFVSHLFAWGEENRELLAGYPYMPADMPIHVTGNPRGDMLRPELRAYFDGEVEALRREHGDFVLINTNFTDVNPFIPAVGLFVKSRIPGRRPRLGQTGLGLPRDFAEGLGLHKRRLVQDFLEMVPVLEKTLPGVKLVIRPHPSENHGIYHELAKRLRRVAVIHRGNVVPWLLACRALVHNGCTTAVESYALGVPAVAYLKTFDPRFDVDFQGLPNSLSLQARSLDELTATVAGILRGELAAQTTPEKDRLIDYYITARQGPLASERILDVLDGAYRLEGGALPAVGALRRTTAAGLTRLKAALTRLNMRRPGPNRGSYHAHRWPTIGPGEIARRVARLGDTLGRFGHVRVRGRSEHLFDLFAEGDDQWT
jgi:surface carbohydrate biosynthesis protein